MGLTTVSMWKEIDIQELNLLRNSFVNRCIFDIEKINGIFKAIIVIDSYLIGDPPAKSIIQSLFFLFLFSLKQFYLKNLLPQISINFL